MGPDSPYLVEVFARMSESAVNNDRGWTSDHGWKVDVNDVDQLQADLQKMTEAWPEDASDTRILFVKRKDENGKEAFYARRCSDQTDARYDCAITRFFARLFTAFHNEEAGKALKKTLRGLPGDEVDRLVDSMMCGPFKFKTFKKGVDVGRFQQAARKQAAWKKAEAAALKQYLDAVQSKIETFGKDLEEVEQRGVPKHLRHVYNECARILALAKNWPEEITCKDDCRRLDNFVDEGNDHLKKFKTAIQAYEDLCKGASKLFDLEYYRETAENPLESPSSLFFQENLDLAAKLLDTHEKVTPDRAESATEFNRLLDEIDDRIFATQAIRARFETPVADTKTGQIAGRPVTAGYLLAALRPVHAKEISDARQLDDSPCSITLDKVVNKLQAELKQRAFVQRYLYWKKPENQRIHGDPARYKQVVKNTYGQTERLFEDDRFADALTKAGNSDLSERRELVEQRLQELERQQPQEPSAKGASRGKGSRLLEIATASNDPDMQARARLVAVDNDRRTIRKNLMCASLPDETAVRVAKLASEQAVLRWFDKGKEAPPDAIDEQVAALRYEIILPLYLNEELSTKEAADIHGSWWELLVETDVIPKYAWTPPNEEQP